MKEFWKKLKKQFRLGQAGFTLAELLVVVGIVVGLAAVILPNVGRFTGKGAEGALATEWTSVQTAMDTYTLDIAPGTIAPNSTATDVFTASGTIDLISTGYLRLPGGASVTQGCYTWDDDGTVTQTGSTKPC
jgi:prepilin-type N-terminal cleavage/methylation domain-containing protein